MNNGQTVLENFPNRIRKNGFTNSDKSNKRQKIHHQSGSAVTSTEDTIGPNVHLQNGTTSKSISPNNNSTFSNLRLIENKSDSGLIKNHINSENSIQTNTTTSHNDLISQTSNDNPTPSELRIPLNGINTNDVLSIHSKPQLPSQTQNSVKSQTEKSETRHSHNKYYYQGKTDGDFWPSWLDERKDPRNQFPQLTESVIRFKQEEKDHLSRRMGYDEIHVDTSSLRPRLALYCGDGWRREPNSYERKVNLYWQFTKEKIKPTDPRIRL